ncbi:molybdopterin cofactor-binding domain-containing protein [Acetomicrobium sp.]|uniref:xanthine dehydrogenase family protein molybdopterin-binding subunit n=1 Tax=Acetomicrobium sp. TaxID=1872099 RepID=UPI001BCB4B39|nr:molybdopterin cofactor-binding domain-containing protein [Acetomicrobium sp.]
MTDYINIGKNKEKVDALALAAGEPLFADDFALKDPLHIAFLYSPHAHAKIKSIDTVEAESMPGVALVLTYKNTPRVLYTSAGQSHPEPSPYDMYMFDDKVRFVGDRVALVAAESEEIAKEAVKKIKVEYEMLPALFDIEEAEKDGAPVLHDGEEHVMIPSAIYRPEKNLAARIAFLYGDSQKGFEEADFVQEATYYTHIASHCALETHVTKATFDHYGRLVLITSTQVPFHARRIVSNILGIPLGKIRVIKPRIGGGFGSKQEVLLEPYVALVAWRTKRPAQIVTSREEYFVSGRTRHAMRSRIKMGVKNDGTIVALEIDDLMNAGAYGPHGPTVLANTGAKVLPLFNKIENVSFYADCVYTNLPVGGAYRGYGATQGFFGLNQHIDHITRLLGIDMAEFVKKWHIKTGETSEVFKAIGEGKTGHEQVVTSCKLSECIDEAARVIGWKEKRGAKRKEGDKCYGVGMAVATQGSGIPLIDMGGAHIKMNEDGSFNLYVGATDIGTGSDTVLAQIAAETLKVPSEKIIVLSSDTDLTPYDVGAYASSTTYVSGNAVKRCAQKVAERIMEVASEMLECPREELTLGVEEVSHVKSGRSLSFKDVAYYAFYAKNQFQIEESASFVSPVSPFPFCATFAEVEVDIKTGIVRPLKVVTAMDCGNVLNPKLAEGQVEGAVLNGVSFSLCEEYLFDEKGKMKNPSFWDYKVYKTTDLPEIVTILVPSFEEYGPYGAKSVGEVAINTPGPAIANAIYDAVGIRMYDLPMTPERVLKAIKEKGVG